MPPRVAYFPDSFHEINGVAHTSRSFVAYAQRHSLPFLCVRAGTRPNLVEQQKSVTTLELPRSIVAVGVEKDLAFDPLFFRHADLIEDELHRFKPDVIHLTGPSELGIFAAYFAWKLGISLAASWHTNVHEYAARRLVWLTRLMPEAWALATASGVESSALGITGAFYSLAKVLYAPNQELCDLLTKTTHRPCQIMQRGVETNLFTPAKRTRTTEKPYVLGYVGRLSIEKNVALLPQIQQSLTAAGIDATFLIIGQGAEQQALRAALPTANFTGVLRGEALAEAYANMDLFIFPSHTDTFGNVVLEALSSGVPAIVTPGGGPKFIVHQGETGIITEDQGFAPAIQQILEDPHKHQTMRQQARTYAQTCSWDAVFDQVYAAYPTQPSVDPTPTLSS